MKLLFKISWLWLLILTTTLIPIPISAQFFKTVPISSVVTTKDIPDSWFKQQIKTYQVAYEQEHLANYGYAAIDYARVAKHSPLIITDFNRCLGLLLTRESGIGEEEWSTQLNQAFRALHIFLDSGKVINHSFNVYLQFVFYEQSQIAKQNGLDTAEYDPGIPEYLAELETDLMTMTEKYDWLDRSGKEVKITTIKPSPTFTEICDREMLIENYKRDAIFKKNNDEAMRELAKKIANDYLASYCLDITLTPDNAKICLNEAIKWFEKAGLKSTTINSEIRSASQAMEYDTWLDNFYCQKTYCGRLKELYSYLGDNKNTIRMEQLLQ